MSAVRPLEERDLEDVADLYHATFLRRRGRPTASIKKYLGEFYFDGPFRDADIPSLVHVTENGRVSGFIGVHTVPYLIDDAAFETGVRSVRAAFCGALMTERQGRDPLAGARLLKGFLAGPQDISLSETASTVTKTMWEKLRGGVIGQQSLEWFRILRPASFAFAAGSHRLPFLRAVGTVAGYADGLLQRRRTSSGLTGFVPEPINANVFTEVGDIAAFAALVLRLGNSFAARPDWSNGYLEHVLNASLEKPEYGEPVIGIVRRKDGAILGGFLYHTKPGAIARVLQIAPTTADYGLILDHLFADAFRRGAAGLRGRSTPALLKVAPGRSMLFANLSASVIHAKDPTLAEPFLDGRGFINGLAGETWNRFFGGGVA